MCHFHTSWEKEEQHFEGIENCLEKLTEMENDGLVIIKDKELIVPEPARPFVRNVCMAFDMHLNRKKPTTKTFSMTI
jgi:oxygen-independent coproporphyrinogen-3 oxidase